MIITIPWLKEHLKTSAKENEIIDRLINIGLEVEDVKENSGDLGKFKIAKVLKAEKHQFLVLFLPGHKFFLYVEHRMLGKVSLQFMHPLEL